MWKRRGLSIVLLWLVCVLGFTSATMAMEEAGRWVLLAPLQTPRVGHTATLLPDGQILVVGGETFDPSGNDGPVLSTVERYDPTSDHWSFVASLSVPRESHTATLLHDGRVLIVGGFGQRTTYDSAEMYDPRTNKWSPAGTLAEGRGDHTATLLTDGRVLVAGGRTGRSHTESPRASAEVYDPATNTWSSAGTLGGTRYVHAAALLLDGRVLVSGGVANPSDPPLASAVIYDPATNRWSPVAPMSRWRFDHTLVPLPDGTVLAFGGAQTERQSEIFDPRTGAWSVTGNAQAQHSEATGLLLPSGQVLAVDVTPEIYDPSTRRWTTVAPPNVPRSMAAVVMLSTGQVVMMGGFKPGDGGGMHTGTVERYDPAGFVPGLPHTGDGWSETKLESRIFTAALAAYLGITICVSIGRRLMYKR